MTIARTHKPYFGASEGGWSKSDLRKTNSPPRTFRPAPASIVNVNIPPEPRLTMTHDFDSSTNQLHEALPRKPFPKLLAAGIHISQTQILQGSGAVKEKCTLIETTMGAISALFWCNSARITQDGAERTPTLTLVAAAGLHHEEHQQWNEPGTDRQSHSCS